MADMLTMFRLRPGDVLAGTGDTWIVLQVHGPPLAYSCLCVFYAGACADEMEGKLRMWQPFELSDLERIA